MTSLELERVAEETPIEEVTALYKVQRPLATTHIDSPTQTTTTTGRDREAAGYARQDRMGAPQFCSARRPHDKHAPVDRASQQRAEQGQKKKKKDDFLHSLITYC